MDKILLWRETAAAPLGCEDSEGRKRRRSGCCRPWSSGKAKVEGGERCGIGRGRNAIGKLTPGTWEALGSPGET